MNAAVEIDDLYQPGLPECCQNPVNVEMLGVGFRRAAGRSQYVTSYLVFEASPFPLQRADRPPFDRSLVEMTRDLPQHRKLSSKLVVIRRAYRGNREGPRAPAFGPPQQHEGVIRGQCLTDGDRGQRGAVRRRRRPHLDRSQRELVSVDHLQTAL